ncbi:hypothetical protein BJV82DRAFT_589677 [Fennellomyces sp. T-0311]|nr:hypothetical protein BJV82DRAFT_589677 [Fennellomyces sp. T-0311]
MAAERSYFKHSPVSKYIDIEPPTFARDPSIIVIEDDTSKQNGIENGCTKSRAIPLDDFNELDEEDDTRYTQYTQSRSNKRACLEPEDIDAIYGDMMKGSRSSSAAAEGSSPGAPLVLDSSSDASSSSSKRRKKDKQRQEASEDETPPGKYEVEAIISHKVYRSMVVQYRVKWMGYSAKDATWEPASSIHEDCPKMCIDYWSKHEPRPINAPTSSSPAGQRKPPSTPQPARKCPYAVRLDKYNITNADLYQKMQDEGFVIAYGGGYPNKGTNWAMEMRQIHLIQRVKGTDQILAYVSWVNRKKTVHAVEELHEHCPDELINYYEARIQFED